MVDTKRLNINQLIKLLEQFDSNSPLVVFANGEIYPVLGVQLFEGEVEIDCGWCALKENESETGD